MLRTASAVTLSPFDIVTPLKGKIDISLYEFRAYALYSGAKTSLGQIGFLMSMKSLPCCHFFYLFKLKKFEYTEEREVIK